MKATGKNLGKLLIEFRNNNNMTQKEASEALGMSLRMYTGYETGEFNPTGARLKKYLHKLASFKVETSENIASEPEPKYGNDKKPDTGACSTDIEFLKGIIENQKETIAHLLEQLKQKTK